MSRILLSIPRRKVGDESLVGVRGDFGFQATQLDLHISARIENSKKLYDKRLSFDVDILNFGGAVVGSLSFRNGNVGSYMCSGKDEAGDLWLLRFFQLRNASYYSELLMNGDKDANGRIRNLILRGPYRIVVEKITEENESHLFIFMLHWIEACELCRVLVDSLTDGLWFIGLLRVVKKEGRLYASIGSGRPYELSDSAVPHLRYCLRTFLRAGRFPGWSGEGFRCFMIRDSEFLNLSVGGRTARLSESDCAKLLFLLGAVGPQNKVQGGEDDSAGDDRGSERQDGSE